MICRSWKKYTALLVYIAVLLLAISDTGIQLLILSTIGPYSRILRLIAMCLLFVKMLTTRYTKKEFFILCSVAVLSIYNYTLCGNIYCIWNVLVIFSLKDVDFSTLFKYLFYGTLFGIVFMGILSFFIYKPTLQLLYQAQRARRIYNFRIS